MYPTKCEHDGCELNAAFMPKICVPAINGPDAPENCLQMNVGVKLCLDHLHEMNVQDMLAPVPGEEKSIRKVFEIVAQGRAAPDFDRAFIEPVDLEGEEGQALCRAIAQPTQQ